MRYALWLAAIFTTASLISDRSGYTFPDRGQVSLAQARQLAPSQIFDPRQSAYDAIRTQTSVRPGALDDVGLFVLIGTQVSIGCVGLRWARRTA